MREYNRRVDQETRDVLAKKQQKTLRSRLKKKEFFEKRRERKQGKKRNKRQSLDVDTDSVGKSSAGIPTDGGFEHSRFATKKKRKRNEPDGKCAKEGKKRLDIETRRVGLHDVVVKPPELKLPKARFNRLRAFSNHKIMS